jgi:hypothetical protein
MAAEEKWLFRRKPKMSRDSEWEGSQTTWSKNWCLVQELVFNLYSSLLAQEDLGEFLGPTLAFQKQK